SRLACEPADRQDTRGRRCSNAAPPGVMPLARKPAVLTTLSVNCDATIHSGTAAPGAAVPRRSQSPPEVAGVLSPPGTRCFRAFLCARVDQAVTPSRPPP